MVCYWLRALRDGLKTKVEAVAASEEASAEVKEACQEWVRYLQRRCYQRQSY